MKSQLLNRALVAPELFPLTVAPAHGKAVELHYGTDRCVDLLRSTG
jgi:hypothetical protein